MPLPATAAVEAPRLPPPLVRRREQGIGAGRVHHDVDEAGVVVDELRVRPGLAAIAGLVEAAFRVGPEEVPDRGDVDDVRILGVDDHAADRLGFLQADILEGLAGVGGLVDPGAERRALAVVGLPGADIQDVGIRLRQGEGADRRHRLLVEERRPGRAVVDGLPQAAGRVGDVHHRRVGFIDGDVVDASAHHRRADRAPDEALEHWVVRLVDRAQRRDRLGGSLRLRAGLRLARQGRLTRADGDQTESQPDHEPGTSVGQNPHAASPCATSAASVCAAAAVNRATPERRRR